MKITQDGEGKDKVKRKEQGRASERKHKEPETAMTDARFEKMQWDPRFQRFPKAKRHVEIDKRFEGQSSCVHAQACRVNSRSARKIQSNAACILLRHVQAA